MRWGDFLAIVTAKKLSMQYTTLTDSYIVFALDGPITYTCTLIFTTSSANYPFPYPDGYTASQNNTDVGTFTGTYQATANTVTNYAYGATGAAVPLSAMQIGGDSTGGLLEPVGTTAASTAATTSQVGLVASLSPNSPLPAGSNALGSVSVTGTVAVTQSTNPWLTQDAADGPVTPGTAATKSQLGGMVYSSSSPSVGPGEQVALQSDTQGNLLTTNLSISGVNLGTPISATQIGGVSTAGHLIVPGVTLGSTVPTAAQQALVVTISPNSSPIPLPVDQSGSLTMSAINSGFQLDAAGYSSVSLGITGTWVGLIVFQWTADGTNWSPLLVFDVTSGLFVTQTSVNGQFRFGVAGVFRFRINMNTYTSGTADVAYEMSIGAGLGFSPSLITDGTNGPAAVKPASTAAVASDAALVVAQSPNSPLPAGTNALGTVGVTGSVAVTGTFWQTTQPVSGTFWQATQPVSGTVTVDQGTSPWVIEGPAAAGSPVSGNPVLVAGSDGTDVRTLETFSASGFNALTVAAQGMAAAGSAVEGNPVLIGASDGTDVHNLMVNLVANGMDALMVEQAEDLRTTYSTSITNLATAATATDIFTIYGSATTVVRITRVTISATQTTAGTIGVLLIRRSSANTGGTSTSPAIAPMDSNNAAATATVKAYTVNPTGLGTTVATILSEKLFVAAPATASGGGISIFDFGIRGTQPVVLRGVAEGLVVNLNSVTVAGSSFCIEVEWTEDSN
jgi:hypothetical protein